MASEGAEMMEISIRHTFGERERERENLRVGENECENE